VFPKLEPLDSREGPVGRGREDEQNDDYSRSYKDASVSGFQTNLILSSYVISQRASDVRVISVPDRKKSSHKPYIVRRI